MIGWPMRPAPITPTDFSVLDVMSRSLSIDGRRLVPPLGSQVCRSANRATCKLLSISRRRPGVLQLRDDYGLLRAYLAPQRRNRWREVVTLRRMSRAAKRRNMPTNVRRENVRRPGGSARLSEGVSPRDPSGQRPKAAVRDSME